MAKAVARGDDEIPVLINRFAHKVQRRFAAKVREGTLADIFEIAYKRLEKEYLTDS